MSGPYLYHRCSGENFYVVGFYDPEGNWQPESDQTTKEEAATRVAWLNGSGGSPSSSADAIGLVAVLDTQAPRCLTRDEIAVAALQGFIAHAFGPKIERGESAAQAHARAAFTYADAFVAERSARSLTRADEAAQAVERG